MRNEIIPEIFNAIIFISVGVIIGIFIEYNDRSFLLQYSIICFGIIILLYFYELIKNYIRYVTIETINEKIKKGEITKKEKITKKGVNINENNRIFNNKQ